ncbi:hypothetical protein [Haliangium ochraceum]|uniref:Uncharacterized protein n=1 Tax=Haliangium ochraceum (strain DSM 14365 / JCM 11303 / SMP-2) TaxID=502025 RepID=D0LLQ9_HALO1|nr:hypothetical protein [Haliangium ochraceum]ACY13276.1 hypothetical protein Hoch_0644 [Haliangium ochraceum DSM 14365]
MQRTVQLFVLPPSLPPASPPTSAGSFAVEAATADGLRDAARDVIRERGLAVRAISFAPGGLVAYAKEQA